MSATPNTVKEYSGPVNVVHLRTVLTLETGHQLIDNVVLGMVRAMGLDFR